MGTGSPGQMEVHSELCADFDLGAPMERTHNWLLLKTLLSNMHGEELSREAFKLNQGTF